MIASPASVMGSTYPRLSTPPIVTGPAGPCGCGCALTPATTYGFDVEEFAADVLRKPLDPWQRYLAIHAGELLPNGGPRLREVLVLVARQNGKTRFLEILTLFWMFVDRVKAILGTSTNLKYARKAWGQAIELAEGVPDLAREIPPNGIRRANGEEEFNTIWGSCYEIAASNRKGGRSTTLDRLVMDELREHHSWDAYNAAKPATNAVWNAQIWSITNMGDDKSVVLNALRKQALDGTDPQLGLFEWSSPPEMAVDDPEALAMANPSLGLRVTLGALMGDARRAKLAGGEQLTTFLTEVHCRHVPLLNPAIDMEGWGACADPANTLDHLRDRVVLCLEVSLDELHACVYAAAVDGDLVRIDGVEAWDGAGAATRLAQALPGMVERVNPRVVGWYASGPAAAIAAKLTEKTGWPEGVELVPIDAALTSVCMGFAESVRMREVRHSGDPLLTAHVQSAEKIDRGDGWRFGRRDAGQVDAAYAAAGAVHLARTLPESEEQTVEAFFV